MEYIIMALPVFALIWLVISIIQFCRTNKEDVEKRRVLKKQIKISSIIIAAWVAIVGGFLLLIMYSIAVYGM